MGVLVVMTATGAVVVLPSTEVALSLSSGEGGGAIGGDESYWGCGSITIDRDDVVADVSGDGPVVVMTAAGSENPRDPAAMAVSPPTGMALALLSVGMGGLVVMTAAGSENPRDSAAAAVSPLAEMALSLSSVRKAGRCRV